MSCVDSSGRTLSIRCKKECARGSAAPLANGLSTVYGWHDGDRSQRFAFSREISAVVRVPISVLFSVSFTLARRLTAETDFVGNVNAQIGSVHLARGLVPVVSGGYRCAHNTAAMECKMEASCENG